MSQNYNKQNPFLASIKERYNLSKPHSKKNTKHLVLDLKDSGLVYEVGDSIGIFPIHDSDLVNKTLHALRATGREPVQSKLSEESLSFFDYLQNRGNITDVSPKLFKEVINRQSNEEKKSQLEELLKEDRRECYKKYVGEHEIWDFLLANEEVHFSVPEFIDLLMPLLPRFYSIASSQKYVGNEVHLTIAPLEYESRGHMRYGVCTRYLCDLIELDRPIVPIFIQPAHAFRLPEDVHAPVIMIGPGTGVAPFRAFMQERILHHRSKAKHWLFFGERNREHDFYYEDDWSMFASEGDFELSLAFSRDQDLKVYVQHKMEEQGKEIFRLLETGAYFYVCGDAQRMAKDVEAALQAIIQQHGNKSIPEAREYIKRLRQQKRYLRDVY